MKGPDKVMIDCAETQDQEVVISAKPTYRPHSWWRYKASALNDVMIHVIEFSIIRGDGLYHTVSMEGTEEAILPIYNNLMEEAGQPKFDPEDYCTNCHTHYSENERDKFDPFRCSLCVESEMDTYQGPEYKERLELVQSAMETLDRHFGGRK